MLSSQIKTSGSPVVLLEHVSKIYRLGQIQVPALDGIDLQLEPGEFVVVLGPSGSGKTTLLNIIGGLDIPTSGRVTVAGIDITHCNEAQITQFRRRKIGFVFQFFNLLPNLTARENVEIAANLTGTPHLVDEVLHNVGLTRQARQFPSQLSGGEQQRVAISRALVTDAPIIICDEPTGNLDYNTGRHILKLMTNISRNSGKTFLVVSHNTAVGHIAQRVLHMRDGRIVQVNINPKPIDPELLEW